MRKRIIGAAGQRIPDFVSKISRKKLYRHWVKDNDLPPFNRSETCQCFSDREPHPIFRPIRGIKKSPRSTIYTNNKAVVCTGFAVHPVSPSKIQRRPDDFYIKIRMERSRGLVKHFNTP